MFSLTSCRQSRSPLETSTSKPAASAWVARVAMMSSASIPSRSRVGTRNAASTSLISATWPENSTGELLRLALYSAYCSLRKVLRDTSKATAT
jgi:hypothetical protein